MKNYFRKYDLKGSTVDREASDKEKEKELPTLKDNDFVKDGTKVVIGDDARERLMETLTADVEVDNFFNYQCLSFYCGDGVGFDFWLFLISFLFSWIPFVFPSQFLMKLQMMDYSLLLGVHDCEQAEQENKEILERSERKFLRPYIAHFIYGTTPKFLDKQGIVH